MARKGKAPSVEEEAPLPLAAADGSPLVLFPPAVVQPLRRMTSLLIAHDRLPSRIGVIAALRQEGVTFTTLALAATLAHDLSASVCAVELNWWWPGMAAALNVSPTSGQAPASTGEAPPAESGALAAVPASDGTPPSGAAAVLDGRLSLDEALLRTALPNLALLPAGVVPVDQRPRLARSTAVRDLIDRLAERFDRLLLDVPAVRATSDATVLAGLAQGCLMVIGQGATPRSQAREALDDVSHLSMLGVILNRNRVATPRFLLKFIPQE
jgi:Mrp family chromosome partitioning ATPase